MIQTRTKLACLRHLLCGACMTPILWAVAPAQVCKGASDMEPSTSATVETAAKRYLDMAVRGDVAAMKQNSIPTLASDFSGVEAAIKEAQPMLASSQATMRPLWLLEATGNEPLARAEFLCGVFGARGQTANSAVFVIPNLPPGNFAVSIFDVAAATPQTVSFVLQQSSAEWKLGGFYAKSSQAVGHDGNWFADRAREFKTKGHNRNAWLYFMQARELLSPLPFMSNAITDKLYDEMHAVQPTDLPVSGAPPVDFAAGGKTYKLTSSFPLAFGNDLDLVVKYQAADVSNSAQTYQENIALIKALVAKYPELRDGFAGVVVRAVEPSGRDYGSLLAMKDIK